MFAKGGRVGGRFVRCGRQRVRKLMFTSELKLNLSLQRFTSSLVASLNFVVPGACRETLAEAVKHF
jgi:hypothetical protein